MTTRSVPQVSPQLKDNASQILATEHWSLLSGRSMLWNESFSRTSVFLNVLSAAVVALALVADATEFGDAFALFAVVLFPLVFFLGIATFARLLQVNMNEVFHVAAMNRLRHGYIDIAPELAPYFTTDWHDDIPGVQRSYALGAPMPPRLLQVFITTPMVVATIDAIIAAAGAALVGARYGLPTGALVTLGAVVFGVLWILLFVVQVQVWKRGEEHAEMRFPRPQPGDRP